MAAENTVKLHVQLGIDARASAAELDELTRQLQIELSELRVQSVERPTAEPAPSGARAIDVSAIGSLAVALAPAVVGPVLRTIQGWLRRGEDRTIKVQIGDDAIELAGASLDQQQQLIDAFIARQAAAG